MQDLQTHSSRAQQVLIATVAISFLLLLASVGVMWNFLRGAQSADGWVLHAMQVKRGVAGIETVLTGAEGAQRGYLLTGDAALLEPVTSARAVLTHRLRALRDLVAGNPEQITRIDELNAVIERRLATSEEALRLSRAGRAAEMIALERDRGRALMAEFHRQVDEIDRTESELQLQRQQQASARRERFFQSVGAMLIMCGVLALFALTSVRRYVATLESAREMLQNQNRLLEERVQERTQELACVAEAATRERNRAESLLTDVNHRIGNNLALVSSFLTMQQRTVRNAEAIKVLDAARARVHAIASAHRKLRLGADFATVRANEVLAAVIDNISAGLPPGDLIRIDYDVAPLEINARDAVSLGVLTSELVMNAVKHAFDIGEAGQVSVVLAKPDTAAPFIEVADNGVGWHEKQKSDNSSLGAKIIEMVARQFGGRPERSAHHDDEHRPGTRIRIELLKLQIIPPAT